MIVLLYNGYVINMDVILDGTSEILVNLDAYIEAFLGSMGIWGAIFSCFLITIESIIPILPVCVFITLVFYSFGNVIGFFISWIFTCLGCILSFYLFRSKVREWFERKFLHKGDRKKLRNFMKYIGNMSLSSLVILLAIPFTPASVVNVAAGLSKISSKKFISAVLIGKLFMVYFWGYIGTTLIESFTHPVYLVRIFVMLIVAFVISKIVNTYWKLD